MNNQLQEVRVSQLFNTLTQHKNKQPSNNSEFSGLNFITNSNHVVNSKYASIS